MELKEKDKLLLLYEQTTNLIPESNKISKEKLDKVDSTLNNKKFLLEKIIKTDLEKQIKKAQIYSKIKEEKQVILVVIKKMKEII